MGFGANLASGMAGMVGFGSQDPSETTKLQNELSQKQQKYTQVFQKGILQSVKQQDINIADLEKLDNAMFKNSQQLNRLTEIRETAKLQLYNQQVTLMSIIQFMIIVYLIMAPVNVLRISTTGGYITPILTLTSAISFGIAGFQYMMGEYKELDISPFDPIKINVAAAKDATSVTTCGPTTST